MRTEEQAQKFHGYALVLQTSFRGKTSSDVAKYRLLSQANLWETLRLQREPYSGRDAHFCGSNFLSWIYFFATRRPAIYDVGSLGS